MARQALVIDILISAPSDLPPDHRDIIHRSVRVWNTQYGRFFNVHFQPTDWQEGASPGIAQYPQQVLNDQIVDEADMALAIFTDRMGTETPEGPSGTAEEIQRLLDQGKDVAVLRNSCQRAPVRGTDAVLQKQQLEDYLSSLGSKALIADYDTAGRLSEVINNTLATMAGKFRRDTEKSLTDPLDSPTSTVSEVTPGHTNHSNEQMSQGVWPRVEVSEITENNSRGKARTKRRWYLVLESTFAVPLRNVRFHYERSDGSTDNDFDLMAERHEVIDILPPKGSATFPIFQSMQSPSSAICVVSWDAEGGSRNNTRATVRTH